MQFPEYCPTSAYFNICTPNYRNNSMVLTSNSCSPPCHIQVIVDLGFIQLFLSRDLF